MQLTDIARLIRTMPVDALLARHAQLNIVREYDCVGLSDRFYRVTLIIRLIDRQLSRLGHIG